IFLIYVRFGGRNAPSPQCLAADRIQTQEQPRLTVLRGRLHKQPLAPDDGRRIPRPGHGHLPQDAVFLIELHGNVLVVGNSGAIRPAEARPVVGKTRLTNQNENKQYANPDYYLAVHRSSSSEETAGLWREVDYRKPGNRVKRQAGS